MHLTTNQSNIRLRNQYCPRGRFKQHLESVRLDATHDLLDRAGFRPVDRHEIVKEKSIVKHKSIEELNAQLVSLVGENGAELLVGAFRSRRSISGPELA